MTITKKECVVVASVLLDDGKPGQNVCTALAYAPTYWESPEAAKLAEAMLRCTRHGWKIGPETVSAMLNKEYRPWIDHPTFKDGLPLSCAESVAAELLPHYKAKRIRGEIAKAYYAWFDKPQEAVQVAKALISRLGDLV